MHRPHRPLALPIALAVWLVAAPGAAAQQSLEARERATGTITIEWRGDPARGCAEMGLCDVSGSVTFAADGSESSSTSSALPPRMFVPSLSFSTQPPVARVFRGPPGDPAGSCVDGLGSGFVTIDGTRLPGGRARFVVSPFDTPAPVGPLGGRCAGPLVADVAEAMPVAEADARRLRSGSVVVDFSGRRAFAGGPFSGEVTSTLRIERRSRVVRGSPSIRARIPEGSGPRAIGRRTVLLALDYDIVRVRGGLVVGFGGAADPFCLPLDACGLRGTLELGEVSAGRGASIAVFAEGPPSALRGGRGVRAALRALKAGRLRMSTTSFQSSLRARVTMTSLRDGAIPCRESRTTDLPSLVLAPRAGALRLSLGAPEQPSPDLFASRCPGARGSDLADGAAGGAIALRDVGDRRLRVPLRALAGTGDGYEIAPRSDLVVELRRGRASVSGSR